MADIKLTHFDECHLKASAPLDLPDGTIHLWHAFTVNFEPRYRELKKLLSGNETARLESYHFQKDRTRFAVSHGILRILIGRYSGIRPELADIRGGLNEKPYLESNGGSDHFSFSLSHSHNLSVFAFYRSGRVGVDVEFIRSLQDYDEIVSRHFHPKEIEVLRNLPPRERLSAFYDVWTRKEAFLKATGEGLSRPLDSFCVCQAGQREIGCNGVRGDRVFRLAPEKGESPGWELVTLAVAPGYACSLAYTQGVA